GNSCFAEMTIRDYRHMNMDPGSLGAEDHLANIRPCARALAFPAYRLRDDTDLDHQRGRPFGNHHPAARGVLKWANRDSTRSYSAVRRAAGAWRTICDDA